MQRVARLRTSLTIVAIALAIAHCGRSPVGPSLSNVPLTDVTLQPTTGNAELCCCRVVGTATNRNATPVHVTVKFSAFSGTDPLPLGTIVYFIEDLQPEARHRIDASGFFFSCGRVSELKSEVDVKGLEYPRF